MKKIIPFGTNVSMRDAMGWPGNSGVSGISIALTGGDSGDVIPSRIFLFGIK
jgi:hypothetical protein